MPCQDESMPSVACSRPNQTFGNAIPDASAAVFQPILPDAVVWWVQQVVGGFVCQFISVFGVVANGINITVFLKLGMKDPINVSLLGLSISDFCACLSTVWYNILLFPPFIQLDLPFNPVDVAYLYAKFPHFTCSRITIAITAFITVERCLCVTFPLQVKDLITTKRITAVIVLVSLLNVATISPVYYVSYYDWVFSPERNRSVYSLLFRANRQEVIAPLHVYIGVVYPLFAFVTTVSSTVILIYKLKVNSKWRQKATGRSEKSSTGSQPQSSKIQLSSRDRKAAMMVVVISALFLITFTPSMGHAFLTLALPDTRYGRRDENISYVIFNFLLVLDTTNASLNVFIYHVMSSNYRKMFTTILGLGEPGKKVTDRENIN